MNREFSGTIEAAMDAEGWLAAACQELRLPSETAFAISLCVEELFLNAVQHGGASAVTVALLSAFVFLTAILNALREIGTLALLQLASPLLAASRWWK